MESTFDKKSTDSLKISKLNLLILFSVCFLLYLGDLHFYNQQQPLSRLGFRIVFVVFLAVWLFVHSPAPFSLRNILFIVSLLISHTFPYNSGFYESKKIEYMHAIILPLIAYLIYMWIFYIERTRKIRRYKPEPSFLYFLIPFTLFPLAFFFIILYSELLKSPFGGYMFAYFLALLVMLVLGLTIDFSKRSKQIIYLALAMMTINNEFIAYVSLIEHFKGESEMILFLATFNKVLLLAGFVNEDLHRQFLGKNSSRIFL